MINLFIIHIFCFNQIIEEAVLFIYTGLSVGYDQMCQRLFMLTSLNTKILLMVLFQNTRVFDTCSRMAQDW
jgi:hypothetical protein